MPELNSSPHVKVGDQISEGDVICLLESMENPILAPAGGTVTKVEVTADQTVKVGDVVAIIEY